MQLVSIDLELIPVSLKTATTNEEYFAFCTRGMRGKFQHLENLLLIISTCQKCSNEETNKKWNMRENERIIKGGGEKSRGRKGGRWREKDKRVTEKKTEK